MNKEEFLLQEKLRADDEDALETIYLEYKTAFISYAKKFNLNQDEVLDVYQDAIIALHQNFVTKQTVLNTSSVKTYLFGIGKNLILNRLKELKKVWNTEKHTDGFAEISFESPELTQEQQLLVKHFKFLGASCKEILKLFYYRNLTIKEIVSLSNYKDENTVKSHKSRCLKTLKTMINSN